MENKKKLLIIILAIVAVVFVVGVAIFFVNANKDKPNTGGDNNIAKIDDWEYDGTPLSSEGFFSGILGAVASDSMVQNVAPAGGMMMESAIMGSASNLGFSVGGAKDANNFRENIKEGYFPISTDITYNGLFYDYTFDTGMANESEDLFSPSYSIAVSKDPISNQKEYYMTVGLNSNIKESDFARKKLNLVVVLDISGSMNSSLGEYYYDNPLKVFENKTKMEAANESVNILIDQLNDDDSFGMILFDDSAYLGKKLSLVAETDMEAIKEHILEIQSNGGTNFEAGYTEATKLFDDLKNINRDEYENRIIVITDAMPNLGDTSKDGLLAHIKENSDEGINTTFIGVGVDFNTALIETISDVRGANYYSVHTVDEFEERMGEQFDFMVTPLVFDLELQLESEDYEIAAVYGSDTVNKESGSIMKVNTLFPSKSVDGEVKGGVVLLKLNKISEKDDGLLKLSVAYKDRNGESHANSQMVEFKVSDDEFYANTGIRKAIALTRYVNTIKNWILYERSEEPRFLILPIRGIVDCNCTVEEVVILLGEHERMSVDLTVSDEYKNIFEQLKTYLESEIEIIEDKTMKQEIEILNKLIEY